MSLIEKTIIDEGKKFLEADNPLKAIECFDEAIDEFKKSGIDQVYYYKGIALSASGNNIEAAKYFYQYILMSHEDAEKCLSNGNNLFDKNLIKAAIIFYDEAINLNQSLEEAHYRKGLALSASNEYSNAIVCFEKAISLNPNYAEAYCEKGIAMDYLNINNNKQANSKIMSCFDKAIEVNQLYTKAYFAKGKMCYKMNKYEDAIIMYNKAIEIEPKYAEAYNYKGLAFHAMSNYEEAIKCYDVSINYGYWTAHYNRGIIFAATNRYDDAIYDFDRVIQLERSKLIIDRAIEEKLRVYKILGKPTDKLCNDEQKHARKEKNVPDMLFSQKEIEAPSRLSIKRAFELSHIHFMTAQNTLSPPIGNRIIIGGIGGSIYSLVLSLELFLKGCRLYYDDKWISSHDIKELTDSLLEASNNSKNYKLQLNKDTLDEIQKLTNLEVRYNTSEVGTKYIDSWYQIVMEILLQAPKYLYEVFMTQFKYGIKNPYGIDLQLLKLEHYNDLNNLYDKLCSKDGCTVFVKKIKQSKDNELTLLKFINYIINQELIDILDIKNKNDVIELKCKDSSDCEYIINIQNFKTKKNYKGALEFIEQREFNSYAKKTIFIFIANCILFPDDDNYLIVNQTKNSCDYISLELPKLTSKVEIEILNSSWYRLKFSPFTSTSESNIIQAMKNIYKIISIPCIEDTIK